MKKIFSFLVLILILAIFSFFAYMYYVNSEVEKLEKQLFNLMQVHTPVKFKILEKKEGVLFLKVKYYDLDNNQITEKEYNIKGEELVFDFYIFAHKNKYFAFPYAIFTDKIAPKNAISIVNDYNSSGFPQIFSFQQINLKHFVFLSKKYEQLLRKKRTFGNDFGNSIHDVKELKQFEIDVVYKFIVHSKGGIEVVVD